MWTTRIASILLLLWTVSGGTEASAQRIFLNGGAMFAEETDVSDLSGSTPAVQGGLKLDYTNHMRLQGAVTYQELLSLDATLQWHPIGHDRKVSPYVYGGYGRYFARRVDDEKGVVPLGVGVEYATNNNVAINLELAGRWSLDRDRSDLGVDDSGELISSLMPTLGVSYKFERIRRKTSERIIAEGREEKEEERERRRREIEEQMNQPLQGEDYFDERGVIPGVTVTSPFQDPTDIAGGPPPFDIPYTRDSLLLASTDPLVIAATDAEPYTDPGVPPISGQVQVSENGDMVRLPDGTFIMGLTDEDPFDIQNAGRKKITVSSFYIDRFEVTNAEYRAYLETLNGSARDNALPDSSAWEQTASRADWSTYFYGSTYDDYPVVAVTWEAAKNYCKWDGKRLPTEAEWEYAARSGRVGGIYPWSGFSPQDSYGRFLTNFNPGRQGQAADGFAFTSPVDYYPPSRWGLHNMAGNVAEWVEDSYTPTYSQLSDLDPVFRDEDETRRVVRGGSWSSNAFQIGVGYRDFQDADEASPRIGFRCAADVSQIEGSSRRSFGPQPQQTQPQSQPQGDLPPAQGDQPQLDQPEEGGDLPPAEGEEFPEEDGDF